MTLGNGSVKERVRGFLQDLRGSPDLCHLWHDYQKDKITRHQLQEAIEQWIIKRTLSPEEVEAFLAVLLQELQTA